MYRPIFALKRRLRGYRRRKKCQTKPLRPLVVFMDLNNKCMLKCKMCYFSSDLRKIPSVTMPFELFEKIAEQVFPKTKSLALSCAAEPLLVPNFDQYLMATAKYDIPYKRITTNALLLKEKNIEAMIKANLSEVQISIDGATKETHEHIRKNSNFSKLCEKIELLQQVKQKNGSKLPAVNILFTLLRCNFRELPDFLELAKRLKVDRVRATHLIPFKKLDLHSESLIHCQEEANQVFDHCRNLAKDLALDFLLPPNFPPGFDNDRPPRINKPNCQTPFNSLYILSDGQVLPCTWFPLQEFSAGNFNEQSFEEIWNAPVYTELRKQFEAKVYTPYCVNCPPWGDDSIDDYVFLERERGDVLNISPDPL
jgi:radical SAM protein with 4Fe4S-binding SPASM domain